MKQITKNEIYKHYIAVDWSKVNFRADVGVPKILHE